jgi:hypothetical protein
MNHTPTLQLLKREWAFPKRQKYGSRTLIEGNLTSRAPQRYCSDLTGHGRRPLKATLLLFRAKHLQSSMKQKDLLE